MAMQFPLNKIERHFKQVLLYAPNMLGNDAVNFFKDSFKRQGWQGSSFTPWRPRKAVTKWGVTPRNKGRAILVDSGRLRRSIRITSQAAMRVTVGTDVPYARAHNEGVRLGLIVQMNGHFRKITTKATFSNRKTRRLTTTRVQTGESWVRPHKRRIDQRIPHRQFMGNSPYLTQKLSRRLQAEMMKGLRTI